MAALDWTRGNVAWGYNEYANWATRGMGRLSPEEALALDLGRGLYTEIMSEGAMGVGMGAAGRVVRLGARGVRGAKGVYGALRNLKGPLNFDDLGRAGLKGVESAVYDLTGISSEMQRIIFEQKRFLSMAPSGTRLGVSSAGNVTLEFNATGASVYDSYISVGGNQTVETAARVSPWGEVVVFEGKHRTISAAVGAEIPSARGGTNTLGRLRYEVGDIPISPAEWKGYRPRLIPVREMVKNPEAVKAAFSGADPNAWITVVPGQAIRLSR